MRPKASVVLNRNINYFCTTEFLNRDLVVIQAQLLVDGTRKVVMASAYFAGDNSTVPPYEVRSLVCYCNKRKVPLLLGCDANAHNEAWESTDCNRRG